MTETIDFSPDFIARAAAHPFHAQDLEMDTTIKGYLIQLLITLWREGEEFSGKHPFGNSGWEFDLYKPLIVGGFVSGKLDSHGDIGDVDTDTANALIFAVIRSMA